MRIIIVDDEQAILDILQAIFDADTNFVVAYTATTPTRAINFAKTNMIDIALIDYDFAGHDMTGIDVIREIRKVNTCKIIMLTSMHQDAKIISAAMAAGADHFLYKANFALLPQKIMEFLAKGSEVRNIYNNLLWNSLNDKQKKAIDLQRQGFTIKEIAFELKESYDNAKKIIAKAKKILR